MRALTKLISCLIKMRSHFLPSQTWVLHLIQLTKKSQSAILLCCSLFQCVKLVHIYVKGRDLYLSLGGHVWKKHGICYWVSQQGFPGRLLFSLCVLLLGDIIREHSVSFCSYADDITIYLCPTKQCCSYRLSKPVALNKHMRCNFLKLNEDKDDPLVVGC